VNVKANLLPEDIARACADAMWAEDDASKGLGMEIVEIGPGFATLAMNVRPDMVNGQRIAHGGFIFTLADSAFAFACNSHNERVVAARARSPSSSRASLVTASLQKRARSAVADAQASTMCA
jgi:acyl-CoA thioesterase